ncbi:MAG: hypothetical protein HZB09_00810 [Candidatus Yonathbacteria bacterium]|nr:hypothetical protein [Candidatus Yonathbacteria bacterium]
MEDTQQVQHYYGDIVRRLFVAAGVLLFVRIPLEYGLIPELINFLVLGVVVVTLFAGLTNPHHRSIAALDLAIACFASIFFEYLALESYVATNNIFDFTFLIRQALAVDFLVALYFSSKTLRGMFLKQ